MTEKDLACCAKSKQSTMLLAHSSVVPKLPNPNVPSILPSRPTTTMIALLDQEIFESAHGE
jgi:hypothetical protein